MRNRKTGRLKRPLAIAAFALALLLAAVVVPTGAVALEEDNQATATTDVYETLPDLEEPSAGPEEPQTEEATAGEPQPGEEPAEEANEEAESETADETNGESGEELSIEADESTDEAVDEVVQDANKEATTGEDEEDGLNQKAEKGLEDEEDLGDEEDPEAGSEEELEGDLEEELEDLPLEDEAFELEPEELEYSTLPQSAEDVASLVKDFPYGGDEAEQEAFLQALPKWEQALDEEWLPRGWLQAQNGDEDQGFYWALAPDFQSFAFIFDKNSLESFLLLQASGAPKTGLLVDDIYLGATITHSGTKAYNGHVLDGNGHTVYGPDSGRHLALTAASNASLTFVNITFDGRDVAGGISLTGYAGSLSSQIFMENVTVQSCVQAGDGAVYLTHLKGTVTDSSFVNNTAQQGGGVYLTGRGSMSFENCRFEGNKAKNGGGVYVNYVTGTSSQTAATFNNCIIDGNASKDNTQSHGIGMYVNNSLGTVSLTDSSVSANYMAGSGYGVGLYVQNSTGLTITNTQITDNYGEGDAHGGAFYVDKGKFTLRDSLVQNNQTQMYFGGGALYNRTYTTITATITNTKFIGNSTRERGSSSGSTNGGGGLGIISLSDSAIMANPKTATTKVEIDGCEFIANRAAPSSEHSYGGAIHIALMSAYDDVTIRNTNFERNSAAEGGALNVVALDVKNFDSNGAQPGYYRMDAVKLVNCEFKYNVATVAGGAIGVITTSVEAEQVTFYNAIKSSGVSFTDNIAPTGHRVPSSTQANGMFHEAVRRQFGVTVTSTAGADPSLLPLSSPFAVNHSDKNYRTPYNNYDIAQTLSSTKVTSGMYKFTYHANGADSYTGQDTFTFSLMPERNILLLSPDEGTMGFTMAGYNFVEWNTAYDGTGNGYQPGELLYLKTEDFDSNKELVLYAIWEYNPGAFTVTYKNNEMGETYTDPVTSLVAPQTVLDLQATGFTTPEGYAFAGWKDSAGTTYTAGEQFLYDHSTMGSSYTLTAQWVEKPDHSLYLYYVDSDGEPLDSDVLGQNPRELFVGLDEQVSVADNLASLTRYKPLYYTIEGQGAKYSLAEAPFTMTAEKDGTVLWVYCASTMLDITVPTGIEFYAMSADGLEVSSPVYRFTNESDLPAEVRFIQLNTTGEGLQNIQPDTDGILFVEEAASPYEMHLTLEADSKTKHNGFVDRFAGINGKPGIQPNSLYNDEVVASLSGKAVRGGASGPLGAFTIGGQYAGPYELPLRNPHIAFQFHVSLLTDAEYEW